MPSVTFGTGLGGGLGEEQWSLLNAHARRPPASAPLPFPSAKRSVGAVFEDVLARVSCTGITSTWRWAGSRPLQVLAGEAVTRLQLVEPRGEPLGTIGHRPIMSWPAVGLTRECGKRECGTRRRYEGHLGLGRSVG
jgi:hypothetical protein